MPVAEMCDEANLADTVNSAGVLILSVFCLLSALMAATATHQQAVE